jgi:hypothetical protein
MNTTLPSSFAPQASAAPALAPAPAWPARCGLRRVAARYLLAACFAAMPPAWAAPPGQDAGDLSKRYAATAPLALVPQEGLQRLTLPLPVLQASRSPSWADVRVLDAQGRPVPMAWLPSTQAPGTTQGGGDNTDTPGPVQALPRFAWPSPPAAGTTASMGVSSSGGNLRVQVDSAGAVVRIESSGPAGKAAAAGDAAATPPYAWLLDLSALPRPGHPIKHLLLDWPRRAEGLSTSVQIEASDDARSWTRIASGPLLELPADAPPPAASSVPSNTTSAAAATEAVPSVKHVDWPAGIATPRYLRLVFGQPLALTGSGVRLQVASRPEQLAQSPVQFLPVAADAQTPFHWALDLQGAVPVKQLKLALPQVNTVLGLRLEQRSDERQPWRAVTSFVAWRLLRDGREQESAAAEWGDTQAPAARHWRLVPDARTAQLPAQPLNAIIGWRAPQLLLVAQGGGDLRLAVGREREPGSAVAWQTLVPGADSLALARLPEARIGALSPQVAAEPGWSDRLKDANDEDRRRWLLWAVLGVAVLGLGALAWRLGKDMRAGPG